MHPQIASSFGFLFELQNGFISISVCCISDQGSLPRTTPRQENQHLRRIRDTLDVRISARDGCIHVEGQPPAVASATEVLEQLQAHARRHGSVDVEDVERVLAGVRQGESSAATPPIVLPDALPSTC